jgi:AraC-like DNA-binding protein
MVFLHTQSDPPTNNMQFWSFIYVIGAAQGLVLVLALLRKQANFSSNRILAVWISLLVLDLGIKAWYLNHPDTALLPLYTLLHFFPYFYGSWFYLYTRSLIRKQAIRLTDLMHFGGFLVMAGININWIINPWENGPTWYFLYEPTMYIYSISYVLAGLWVINQYRRDLWQQESKTEGIDLSWLLLMAVGNVIIWLVAITQWLLPIEGYNHWVIFAVITVWITLLGYLGLTQQPITPMRSLKTVSATPSEDPRFGEVDAKLTALMEQHKLFLKPELNIGQLAKASGYPEYLISLVINQRYQSNFRDYINGLRVRESQQRLQHSEDNILDVAYQSGFVSKSTFNTAFKRHTGLTPSAFRQQRQGADAVK